MVRKREIPSGVKNISILYYSYAVFTILWGIFVISEYFTTLVYLETQFGTISPFGKLSQFSVIFDTISKIDFLGYIPYSGFCGFLVSQIGFMVEVTLGENNPISFGIIIISIGVLQFFIGRGLWKAKQWARIAAIMFAFLGIVLAIILFIFLKLGLIINIFGVVVDLFISGYLVFSKDVKKAFL